MFGCNHHYGKVDNNYQYCKKCGKAIVAPKTECNHKWVERDNFSQVNILNRNTAAWIYMMRCSICGEMKRITTEEE